MCMIPGILDPSESVFMDLWNMPNHFRKYRNNPGNIFVFTRIFTRVFTLTSDHLYNLSVNRADPLQATDPITWELHTNNGVVYVEEGGNSMELSHGQAKKQKWMMKKTHKRDYQYWEYATEMPHDYFLTKEVSKAEAESWYPDLQMQLKKAKELGDGTYWYFVFSGRHCGLFRNYEEFIEARDEEMPAGGLSKKATRFDSLEEAKAWIQASRDEEGAHWRWPDVMLIQGAPEEEE